MKFKTLLVSLAVLMPGVVFAQAQTSFQCSFDGMQRRIVILTEPGVSVPCTVQYYKDTEMPGEVQALWTATSDAGYCELKAQEFAAKLQEWGWTCVAGATEETPESASEPAPAEEPEAESDPEPEVDDTEALEPAA